VPPGGHCLISIGAPVSNLSFLPFTNQPVPNPDYFLVWLEANRVYRVETSATPGVDTGIYLYPPGVTDDSQHIARNDDAPGLGLGSRVAWAPASDGFFIVKAVNRAPYPHERDETYDLLVTDLYPFQVYLPIIVGKPSWR
jgi:hypothetical protein